jgi:hypothetical protein
MLDDILRGRATEIKYWILVEAGQYVPNSHAYKRNAQNLVELRSDMPLDQGL